METYETLNKKSDKDLYNYFLEGNNESFNCLIIRHRKMLTYFLLAYVKNIEVAEDIAQDSFMYILINKLEYDFKFSFKTYLYTIAKSRALNYIKKHKNSILIEESSYFEKEIDFDLENDFIQKEYYNEIKFYIKKLKKEYQIIIYLYYFQGFKYKEICKILNQSMSKTKIDIHRAKNILKKYIKEDNNYDK